MRGSRCVFDGFTSGFPILRSAYISLIVLATVFSLTFIVIYTCPDIFESETFSFRIQKFPRLHVAYSNQIRLSTRIQWCFQIYWSAHCSSAINCVQSMRHKARDSGGNHAQLLLLCRHIGLLGSLSTRSFDTRTATGSEQFPLLTWPNTTTFTLLSIFSPLEMSYTKIWETMISWHAKCSLPVAVRVSKTRMLKPAIVP